MVLADLKFGDGQVKMMINYEDCSDYGSFNNADFYSGTVEEAVTDLYDFDDTFRDSSGEEISGGELQKTCGSDEVLISEEPGTGKSSGENPLCQFQCENSFRQHCRGAGGGRKDGYHGKESLYHLDCQFLVGSNKKRRKTTMEKTMEKIVALAKSRGFVYPGSEIYGGLANTWDYGNLGVELKNNVKRAWWKKFIQESPYNVGVDCAILMNPQTWVASGHLAGFRILLWTVRSVMSVSVRIN